MSDSSLLHAIAGAGAGCASLAITYPLYSRMVRQQVKQQNQTVDTLLNEVKKKNQTRTPSIDQFLQEFKQCFTLSNLEEQFAGLGSSLYAITIQSGIYYYFFKFFLNYHSVTSSPLGNLFVASEAGIATVMMTNPLWVINARQITSRNKGKQTPQQQQQAQGTSNNKDDQQTSDQNSTQTNLTPIASPSSPTPPSSPASLADVSLPYAFYLLAKHEGLAGIYSGVGPALALVSSPALQFASYEYLKGLLVRMRGSSSLSGLDFFWLGAASKIFATLMTYPIQTLKSQLQKDNSPYAKAGVLNGFFMCIRDMARDEGIGSFYRGLKAKILQTGLTAAFLFLIRERLIAILARWAQNAPKLVK